MIRQAYFTRHGRVGERDAVSESGLEEIRRVKTKLDEAGFTPTISYTSGAHRCIETARFLGPNASLVVSKALHIFGDMKTFRRAGKTLIETLIDQPNVKEQDVLIVGHDCLSVVLALQLLENRGVAVDWNVPHALARLDQGEGILVQGNEYRHLSGNVKR